MLYILEFKNEKDNYKNLHYIQNYSLNVKA